MKLIENNPYRILGLVVGVPARDQERQVKRLKQFIQPEQELQIENLISATARGAHLLIPGHISRRFFIITNKK